MKDGYPSLSILETLEDRKTDLVCLGTHGFGGLERFVFGSTAEAVFRKASCPVLTVGSHAGRCGRVGQLRGPVVFATDLKRTAANALKYAGVVEPNSGGTASLPPCSSAQHRSLPGRDHKSSFAGSGKGVH